MLSLTIKYVPFISLISKKKKNKKYFVSLFFFFFFFLSQAKNSALSFLNFLVLFFIIHYRTGMNIYRLLSLKNIFRSDEKTIGDYNISGGSVLHLVLALRGGVDLFLNNKENP
ncbi:hypothetical protein HMI55_004033 [Coelomomyces lativittatus]|nr:hypothetical protein HMI55_004033 [Coelomomyces lativittatus]